ncbi:MAG: hypothetical protein V1701_10550 [Planctomycetota bacterium]
MIINRITISLALVMILGWFVCTQADQPRSILSPYIYNGDVSLTGPITITGKTDLAAGTAVKCLIKGKLTTDRADLTRLLEVYYTSIDEDNGWNVEIPAGYLKTWEGFEIELIASGAERSREYYYFDILSADLSGRRMDTAHFIWASFSDALVLDEELNQLIGAMELSKQNKPRIEQLIKTPLGIYKSREEALASLIKHWEVWEKNWQKKLSALLPMVSDYNRAHYVFPASQERLQQYVNTINEQYISYRRKFISPLSDKSGDFDRSVSCHTIMDTNIWYRNTGNEKNNFSRIVTNELSAKFLKDMTAWLEHFIWLYTDESEQPAGRKELIRKQTSDYFAQLSNELVKYKESEMPFVKLKETSELMEQVGQFIEKSDSGAEVQNYIISLKNKLEVLYDGLR